MFAKGVVKWGSEGCLQRMWWDGVVRGVCIGCGGMGCLHRVWWGGVVRGVCIGCGGME